MPTVYLLPERGSKFHRTADCRQLYSYRGERSTAQAIDLNDVDLPIPCRTCYPDAPVAESVHRPCGECNQERALPCPHNGGVLVYLTNRRHKVTMVSEPGQKWYRRRYVWPERAHRYLTTT